MSIVEIIAAQQDARPVTPPVNRDDLREKLRELIKSAAHEQAETGMLTLKSYLLGKRHAFDQLLRML